MALCDCLQQSPGGPCPPDETPINQGPCPADSSHCCWECVTLLGQPTGGTGQCQSAPGELNVPLLVGGLGASVLLVALARNRQHRAELGRRR